MATAGTAETPTGICGAAGAPGTTGSRPRRPRRRRRRGLASGPGTATGLDGDTEGPTPSKVPDAGAVENGAAGMPRPVDGAMGAGVVMAPGGTGAACVPPRRPRPPRRRCRRRPASAPGAFVPGACATGEAGEREPGEAGAGGTDGAGGLASRFTGTARTPAPGIPGAAESVEVAAAAPATGGSPWPRFRRPRPPRCRRRRCGCPGTAAAGLGDGTDGPDRPGTAFAADGTEVGTGPDGARPGAGFGAGGAGAAPGAEASPGCAFGGRLRRPRPPRRRCLRRAGSPEDAGGGVGEDGTSFIGRISKGSRRAEVTGAPVPSRS
jgi:hypothetical protein